MSVEYKLEAGQYVCYVNDKRIVAGDEVGVLLDLETGSQLRHGNPAQVEARFNEMRQAFLQRGLTQFADDLVFVKGRFELEILNSMLSISGFAGRWYRETFAGEAIKC